MKLEGNGLTYAERKELKKNNLLKVYNESLEKEEYTKAYNVLRKLMKYRMIPLEDEAVSEKSLRELETLAGVKESTSLWDYRRKDALDILPESILFNSPTKVDISVLCREHWGKRRELKYQGDYIVPEKRLRYDIRVKSTEATANGAVAGMCSMYNRLSGLELKNDFMEAALEGRNRIYSIDLANDLSFKIITLGYMVVGHNSFGRPLIRVIMDNAEMENQFIDIKDTYEIVKEAMVDWYCKKAKMGEFEVDYIPMCDVELIGTRQRSKYTPVMTESEFVEHKNKLMASMSKEELEKETDW